jgi:hypothetical protein
VRRNFLGPRFIAAKLGRAYYKRDLLLGETRLASSMAYIGTFLSEIDIKL